MSRNKCWLNDTTNKLYNGKFNYEIHWCTIIFTITILQLCKYKTYRLLQIVSLISQITRASLTLSFGIVTTQRFHVYPLCFSWQCFRGSRCCCSGRLLYRHALAGRCTWLDNAQLTTNFLSLAFLIPRVTSIFNRRVVGNHQPFLVAVFIAAIFDSW